MANSRDFVGGLPTPDGTPQSQKSNAPHTPKAQTGSILGNIPVLRSLFGTPASIDTPTPLAPPPTEPQRNDDTAGDDTAASTAPEAEPPYVMADAEARDTLWSLNMEMGKFAEAHFNFQTSQYRVCKMLTQLHVNDARFVQLVARIASGGPGGIDSWFDLFQKVEFRKALVRGIIGSVLVEQVFKSLYFGAPESVRDPVEAIELQLGNGNGFDRNAAYANAIAGQLDTKRATNEYYLPSKFAKHAEEIATRLSILLLPILKMDPDLTVFKSYSQGAAGQQSRRRDFQAVVHELFELVSRAGMLSLAMRLDCNTVYHFVPTCTEEQYDNKVMDCGNEDAMRNEHPQRREWPAGTTEQERQRAVSDEALITVVCMEGCTAYRRGGWQDGAGIHEEHDGGKMGLRHSMLTTSAVMCRWGRPPARGQTSSFENMKKIHGKAFRQPGFVQFDRLWLMLRRRGRKAARA